MSAPLPRPPDRPGNGHCNEGYLWSPGPRTPEHETTESADHRGSRGRPGRRPRDPAAGPRGAATSGRG